MQVKNEWPINWYKSPECILCSKTLSLVFVYLSWEKRDESAKSLVGKFHEISGKFSHSWSSSSFSFLFLLLLLLLFLFLFLFLFLLPASSVAAEEGETTRIRPNDSGSSSKADQHGQEHVGISEIRRRRAQGKAGQTRTQNTRYLSGGYAVPWARTTKNTDCSTGPLARSLRCLPCM